MGFFCAAFLKPQKLSFNLQQRLAVFGGSGGLSTKVFHTSHKIPLTCFDLILFCLEEADVFKRQDF